MSVEPVTLSTLADLKRAEKDMYVMCQDPRCGHKGRFILDELLAHPDFGPEWKYVGKRFRCKVCGYRTTPTIVTAC